MNLSDNALTDECADILIDSPNLTGLQRLVVSQNHLTQETTRRMRDRFGNALQYENGTIVGLAAELRQVSSESDWTAREISYDDRILYDDGKMYVDGELADGDVASYLIDDDEFDDEDDGWGE